MRPAPLSLVAILQIHRSPRAPQQWAVAMLALLLAGAFPGCGGGDSNGASAQASGSSAKSAANFEGALLPAGLPPHDFTLNDQDGRRVSLRDFRGRVAILAFLSSTSRPAMLIGEQLRGALDELALEHGRPAVPALAISVSPASDTPARVRAYLRVTSLSGRLEYLTGSVARLRAIWRAYRVVPASAGERTYEQGAFVVLIDRAGAARVEIPLEELTPEVLASDVRRLEAL
jgi:protein SCO1